MPGVKYERDSVDKAECTFQGDGQTAAFLSHRSVELSIRQQVSSDLAFRKFFEILFTALHCTALHCTALHCTASSKLNGNGN